MGIDCFRLQSSKIHLFERKKTPHSSSLVSRQLESLILLTILNFTTEDHHAYPASIPFLTIKISFFLKKKILILVG